MTTFTPLTPGFGLETRDVDLSQPLSAPLFAEIEQAFYRGHVLALRGQRLQPKQFLDFARRIGRPDPHVIDQFHHPEHAEILILSNVKKNGEATGLADAGTYWHTDYSYLAEPAKATMLYSIQVPEVGGDTMFANMRAAYDDLSETMKRRIDGMITLNIYGNRDDLDEQSRTAASALNKDQWQKMDVVQHPLVRPHPATRQKALYAVSGTSMGVVGMPQDEAIALLNELKAHATQPKYQLRFKYGVGDVVLWDNPSLLHAATLTDPKFPRTLHRITVKEFNSGTSQ
jgi:taurine dioxygenase